MNKLFEFIYWFKIVLSPLLFFNVIGFIFYTSYSHLWWVWLGLSMVGLVLGIFWAERVRKKSGTITFLSKIYGSDDIKEHVDILENE